VEITPKFSGTLKVSLPLLGWPQPKRYPLEKLETLEGEARNQPTIWYPGYKAIEQPKDQPASHDALLKTIAKPQGTHTLVGEAVALDWPALGWQIVKLSFTPCVSRKMGSSCRSIANSLMQEPRLPE
jgi:hypothetical protein